MKPISVISNSKRKKDKRKRERRKGVVINKQKSAPVNSLQPIVGDLRAIGLYEYAKWVFGV